MIRRFGCNKLTIGLAFHTIMTIRAIGRQAAMIKRARQIFIGIGNNDRCNCPLARNTTGANYQLHHVNTAYIRGEAGKCSGGVLQLRQAAEWFGSKRPGISQRIA